MNDWSYTCEVWYFTCTDVFLINKFFPKWLCIRWWCIFSKIKYDAWFQDPKLSDVCVASTSQDCMSTMLLLSVGNERCDCWVTSSGIMFIPSFMEVGRLMQMFKLKTYTDGMVILVCLLSSVMKEAVAYRGRGLGGSNPPRNSEDVGGVLDHMSKKKRFLDFLL